jgi:hypothetical protein
VHPATPPTSRARDHRDWIAEANLVCKLGRKLYPSIALGADADPDTMDYAVGRLVGEIASIMGRRRRRRSRHRVGAPGLGGGSALHWTRTHGASGGDADRRRPFRRAARTFLTAGLMKQDLAPGSQSIARFNPVNWAVDGGREALGTSSEWGLVASRLGLLTMLALLCGWLATRAFLSYQASVWSKERSRNMTIAALTWPAAVVWVAVIVTTGAFLSILAWSIFPNGTAIKKEACQSERA